MTCPLIITVFLAPALSQPPTQTEAAKRADILIVRMTDETASWEERCKAEDELAKIEPEVVMPRLLRHVVRKMPAGGIYNSLGRDADKDAGVPWQVWYAI